MKMDMQIFNNNEFGEVRAIEKDGEPWFVAKDICDCLGYIDTESALRKLDTDEKLTRKLYASGQNREMSLINESGLYSLVLRSNKPEAKKFKKWVTSEVLPSIRKTGQYAAPQTYEEVMANALALADKKVRELKDKIAKDRPAVTFSNAVQGSDNAILVRAFAKILANSGVITGQNRLYQWFRDNAYLNRNNEPYQAYIERGLFEVVERVLGDGSQTFTVRTTKVTGKGQVYFTNKLISED
jgi:anti-repressor protein